MNPDQCTDQIVDNITKGNDIHIGFYDLCLEVKELDLKDGYENKEEISKLKSTKSQVINNSSSPIEICKLRLF